MNNSGSFSIANLAQERRPLTTLWLILSHWLPLLVIAYFYRANAEYFWALPTAIQAVFIILLMVFAGIQQNGLNFCIHEAVHFLLVKNKKLNDLIADVFFGYPLLMNVDTARDMHMIHHRFLGTEKENKIVIYENIKGWRFLGFVIDKLFGFRFVTQGFKFLKAFITPGIYKKKNNNASIGIVKFFTLILIAQALLILIFTSLSGSIWYYFLFWILPYVTVTQFLKALRSVIEHQPVRDQQFHPYTRTLRISWFDYFLMFRVGFDHHYAHHLYPSVPYYNLGKIPEPASDETWYGALFKLVKYGTNDSQI